MKKIMISNVTTANEIKENNEYLVLTAAGLTRIKKIDITAENKIPNIFIPAYGEYNTGMTAPGLYYVMRTSGSAVLINIGYFTHHISIISKVGTDDYSISDIPDKICVFRKTNSGSIYIKNNLSISVSLDRMSLLG